MMNTLITVILGIILFVLESVWHGVFLGRFLMFNGIVALLTWHALRHEFPYGVLAPIVLGFLSGIFTIVASFLYLIVFLMVFFTVRYLRQYIFFSPLPHRMILVLGVSFAYTATLMIMTDAIDLIWPWALLQAVINAALSPFLFWCFNGFSSLVLRFAGKKC
ncbi:MAG: hypothetical protein PHC35_07100 [Deltaproteobacteria bacterium]|jgi:hypothetical protein|nr:hypothetical protein [Deltaproteobacteria bacterium]